MLVGCARQAGRVVERGAGKVVAMVLSVWAAELFPCKLEDQIT